MTLENLFIKKLEKYEAILIEARSNNGNGSFSYEDLKALAVIYAEITNDPPCRTCSRDWLWRLGLWFDETKKKNENEKIVKKTQKPRKK